MHSAASRHRIALPAPLAAHPRRVGLGVTLLVHALLIVAWQMARTVAPPVAGDDEAMLWLRVPALRVAAPPIAPPTALPTEVAPIPKRRTQARPAPVLQVRSQAQEQVAEPAPEAPSLAAEPAVPNTAAIMDSARRSIGDIDRALRKERQPTIVLPPDSPQIRLRRGIEHAREMAPPRMWEAPRVVELVNNTGDGARRTRVITGNRTYCLTDRAPTTNVEMIEMHGKQRFTTCPKDEEPAKQQEWRTARD